MALSPADLRAQFPACREHTYLNAAASSPVSEPVAAAVRAHLDDTVLHGDVSFPRWLAFKETLRARVARFLGASGEEIAFLPSTSMAFNVAAHFLKLAGVREVLTLEGEFPSTTLPFLQGGLRLNVLRPRSDGSYSLGDIEAALRPETGAIALSAVQFASGFRVDLAGLAALTRARGLRLALNIAQAAGQVPIDVVAASADFAGAPGHKWLMSGYGNGIAYVKREWLERFSLPFGGWLSVPEADRWQPFSGATRTETPHGFLAQGTVFRREASALEAGGGGWAQLYALDAALELHEQVGVDTAAAHIARLQATLRAGLRSRGFSPNAPDDPACGSGICVFPVRGEPLAVVRALLAAGIVTSPRGVGVRISTHVFNDEEDVAKLLAALDRLGIAPA